MHFLRHDFVTTLLCLSLVILVTLRTQGQSCHGWGDTGTGYCDDICVDGRLVADYSGNCAPDVQYVNSPANRITVRTIVASRSIQLLLILQDISAVTILHACGPSGGFAHDFMACCDNHSRLLYCAIDDRGWYLGSTACQYRCMDSTFLRGVGYPT